MVYCIDDISSMTGWTSNSSLVVLSENGFQSHIVTGTKSLKIKVSEGANGKYFEKKYASPVIVSGYKNLRFFMSKYFSSEVALGAERESFTLKFSVGNTTGAPAVYTPLEEWFVPVTGKQNMNMINVELGVITSFNTIRFTVIGNVEEFWWLDYIIACTDEFVIDSLLEIVERLDCQLKFSLGHPSSNLAVGTTQMALPDWVNVSKYSIIQIEEGSKVEKHQVAGEVSGGKVEFSDEEFFDGNKLINSFTTNALLYLVVPAVISGKEMPISVPGIYITGMVPVLPNNANAESVFDSYKVASNTKRRISPQRDMQLPVQIEVRCVQPELMVTINNYIQNIFSDEGRLFINGVYHDLEMVDTPKYDPGDLEEEIPYTVHYYQVSIIDILNVDIRYITIPSYSVNMGFFESNIGE